MTTADDWRSQARCKGLDGKDGRTDFLNATTATQRKLCRDCPVQSQCLEDALKYDDPTLVANHRGIVYGGLDGPQRADILNHRGVTRPKNLGGRPPSPARAARANRARALAARGLTYGQIAEALSVHHSTVVRYLSTR